MTIRSFTLRLDPQVQTALSELSKLMRRPVNKLVNEAIRDYLDRRGREAEGELEGTLERLRAYRKTDPQLRRSLDEFAEAEAAVVEDPAEGTVARSEPIRSEIQDLLNG
jgi:hypothetical protein